MTPDLSNTINNIYESSLHPELWSHTLTQISDLMHAGPAEVTLMDLSKTEPDLTVDCRLPPETREEYFEHLYATDKRIPRMLAMPEQGGIATERLLNEEEWKESGDLREWLERHEIGNLIASNVRVRGLITWLGVGRKGYNKPFTSEELAIYSEVLPHIMRALRIDRTIKELKFHREGLAGLLSLNDKAVLFLDQGQHVLFANQLAMSLAANKVIGLCNNHLSLSDTNANKSLTASLSGLAKGLHTDDSFKDVMVFTTPTGSEFGLRLLPYLGDVFLDNDGALQQAMIIITGLDGTKAPVPAEIARFAVLFGLTPAETSVIEGISSQQKLSEYANQKGIKADTARKQLKSAMEKVGVHSQKELLRRLDRFCFLQ